MTIVPGVSNYQMTQIAGSLEDPRKPEADVNGIWNSYVWFI